MKRSLMKTHNLARVVVFCFLALTTLSVVSTTKPGAAGKIRPVSELTASPGADFKDALITNSPAAPSGNFTLNKHVYPGNTTFTSLSPTLTTTASAISSWSIGVPLLYVITIGNSNPAQTSLVNITLRDTLSPSSLDPNFVILKISCDAFNGAACPFPSSVPALGTTLPLDVPNIQIKVGTEVVVRIEGYYKTPGTFQNTFSVFETGKEATTKEQGPPKNVQIVNNFLPIDLGINKTSSTNDTAVSTTNPATIHYKLTVTGDSSHDFYPQGLLRIEDRLHDGNPPLPTYSIPVASFICSSVNGSTCPAAPSPASPGTSFSGANSDAFTYLNWPAGASTVIKKGDIITMQFDVEVGESSCGNSSMSVQNRASFSMSDGSAYSDSNNANNSSSAAANTFTTGLQPCPPPVVAGTITKTRVCPSSGCPTVNWGDTVPYKIVVTNNLATAQTFKVSDFVANPAMKVPLRATLAPNSVPSDVHCSPATIACTTTPSPTIPPRDLFDFQFYSLFDTQFTLQANGSTDDTVTLTFDIKIDKLADCQTEPGNFFDNVATLSLVSSSSVIHVAQTGVVRVTLLDLPICNLKVTKVLDQPTSGITFGQPVSYTITYENLDSQPVTVHTLRDVVNIRDNSTTYANGNIPLTNVMANCTTTTGVSPMPSYQLTTSQIFLSNPDWAGIPIIHETSQATGITFPANSKLLCSVSFTPLAPSATDNLCQGKGQPELLNSAFMVVAGFQPSGPKPPAPFFAQATAPLPLCRKVGVLKKVAGGATSTGPNGLLTFEIQITNFGNHSVSDFLLKDQLPAGFTDSGPVGCNPTSACLSAAFSGTSPRELNAVFNPIPASPNNTVTLTFNVNASAAGGTFQNTAIGSFGPGTPGTNFYFEGDPDVLLVNSAQVQVLTPTLQKSFQPNNIVLNGSAVLTFTITNQTSDPAQTGISFTDLLPSGLTVTSAPSTACGGSVSLSGGNSITLSNGTLAQGQHQCQFVVKVTASSCGTFVNDQTNFSHVTNLDVTNAKDTLTVTGCPPATESCPVKTNEISCKADGTGGYLYTFTVTNNTGHIVTDVLLTPAPGSGITLNPKQPSLPAGGMAIGASLTFQVTITGGQPHQQACFDVTLMTTNGECCTTRVCLVLPDCCAIAKDENIVCNRDGTYTYTLSVVNTGVNTIEHIYLYPPAGVTMTPNYFPVSLKPGDTFTTKLIIKGAKSGDKLCFGISLHSADMESCCKGEHCIVLPDCKVEIAR